MKKNLFFFPAVITFIALFNSPHLAAQNTSPYWSLAGNNNASSTSKFGTTNNISLGFYTNNVQRMIINSSAGLVGIGTASPNSRLHVNSAAGQNPFRAQVNGATKFFVDDLGGVTVGSSTTPPANGLYVSGRVGIGTATPTNKLHVVGTSLFTNHIEVMEAGITATNNAGDGVTGIGSGDGVYGFGNKIGLYGVGAVGGGIFGYGVKGVGFVGVYAESSTASGDGVRSFVSGSSAYGVNAQSQSSNGVFGQTNNASAYGGYFVGGVYSSNGVYASSDRNLKQDISDVPGAMSIINKLQPKSYTFRQDGNYKLMHLPGGKHYGLIAQDVEQVLPGLVKASTFETGKAAMPIKQQQGATTPSETIEFKALNYTELIPITIKGLQELDAENKDLKEENKMIRQELSELRQMVMDLKNGRSSAFSQAFLEQNNPNPVAGNTIIRYQVPLTTVSAKVSITNVKGQLIKSITIQDKGAGQLSFNSATLAAGTYNYSLWVDGKQIDTKRLIIAR